MDDRPTLRRSRKAVTWPGDSTSHLELNSALVVKSRSHNALCNWTSVKYRISTQSGPMEALLEQLSEYITVTEVPSQQTPEDIQAYQQLLSTCVEKCLVQPATALSREGSLKKTELRGATMTVGLLRVAANRLPEIFALPVEGGIGGHSAGLAGAEKDTEGPKTAGPVLLSQLYAPPEAGMSDTFTLWLVARLFNILASPELDGLHPGVLDVLDEVLYIVKEGRGSDDVVAFTAIFRDILDLFNDLQELGIPNDETIVQVTIFKHLERAHIISAVITQEINLRGVRSCNILLQNVYRLMLRVVVHSKFAVGDCLPQLWELIIQRLESPHAQTGLKDLLILIDGLQRNACPVPSLLAERLLMQIATICLECLSERESGTTALQDRETSLDDAVANHFKLCLESLCAPSNLSISLSARIRQLLEPQIFHRIRSSTLQIVLLQIYSRTLRFSRYIEPAMATALLDYSANESLREAAASCFDAILLAPSRKLGEDCTMTASRRKRKHGDSHCVSADGLNDQSHEPQSKRHKVGKDTSLEAAHSTRNFGATNGNSPNLADFKPDTTDLLLKHGSQLLDELGSFEGLAPNKTLSLVQGFITILDKSHSCIEVGKIAHVLDQFIRRLLPAAIRAVESASVTGDPSMERFESVALIASDLATLAIYPHLWSSDSIRGLSWILCVPWMNELSTIARAECSGLTDPLATAGKNAMLDLNESIDFRVAGVDAPTITSLSMPCRESLAAKCLKSIVSVSTHHPDLRLCPWTAYLVLKSLLRPIGYIKTSQVAYELFPIVVSDLADDEALQKLIIDMFIVPGNPDAMETVAGMIGFLSCARARTLLKSYPSSGFGCSTLCMICDGQVGAAPSLPPVAQQAVSLENWSPFLPLLEDGSETVQQRYLRSALRLIAHTTMNELDLKESSFAAKCLSAMSSPHRSVRIAAGDVAIALFTRLQSINQDYTVLSDNELALAKEMKRIAKTRNPRILQTFSRTIGRIGQTAGEALLVMVLYYLLDQLANENVILRAVASEEIQSIARARSKTVRQLFEPYRDEFSVYLIDRVENEPRIYRTCLQLLGMSNQEFLEGSLQYILPHLVVEQDADKVQEIARILRQSLAVMLVNEGGNILPFILMQGKEYKATLNFFLQMISKSVGISKLLKSFALTLIIKLTMELGASKSSRSRPVLTQGSKAEGALAVIKTVLTSDLQEIQDSDRPAVVSHVGNGLSAFLHSYILGILEHVNQNILDIDNSMSLREKIKTVRSLTEVIGIIGPPIVSVIPQIMATLQTALDMVQFRSTALQAWEVFLTTLDPIEISPLLNQICISLCKLHREFTPEQMSQVIAILEYLLVRNAETFASVLAGICPLPDIPDFGRFNVILKEYQGSMAFLQQISLLLPVISDDNASVSRRALQELRKVLIDGAEELHVCILAETVDVRISQTVRTLLEACRRYNGSDLDIQRLCCECLGAIGATDPSRLDVVITGDTCTSAALNSAGDFSSFEQAVSFACSLIERRLAPACRSTRDTKMQTNYAFAIQELLRFCGFTADIVDGGVKAKSTTGMTEESSAAPLLRRMWNSFSRTVIATIRPLLNAKYQQTVRGTISAPLSYPLFSWHETFRDWLQTWTVDLIRKTNGQRAQDIFSVCKNVVVIGDINVAQFILPHLVLNILVAGKDDVRDEIYTEFISVLEDVRNSRGKATEKRQLSTQMIFSLVDHLTQWLRLRRQEAAKRKAAQARRQGRYMNVDETDVDKDPSALQVESFLMRIPQSVMADASYCCRAYARALLHFEQHIRQERTSKDETALQPLYSHLQKIYAHLDEPDGMEGISTKFLTPSLEQQLLEHESAGRWTAAQTCYELSLQQEPDKLVYHIGLLNCLKNLGHLETLLNHVRGTVFRHSQWSSILNSYAIEAAWKMGNWTALDEFLSHPFEGRFETSVGVLVNAGRKGDRDRFASVLQGTREALTADLATASMESYRRGYDCAVKLHILHEIESVFGDQGSSTGTLRGDALLNNWDSRLKITMPSFRVREPILNVRRILLQEQTSCLDAHTSASVKCGQIWLQTAKASRKAGHLQPAYNALLHASRLGARLVHLERAKWLWDQKQSHKAMFELQAMVQKMESKVDSAATKVVSTVGSQILLSEPLVRAKTQLLLTRWMEETSAAPLGAILTKYQAAAKELPEWEKSAFYLGRYFDKLYDADEERQKEQQNKGDLRASNPVQLASLAYSICHQYQRALTYGTRYIYQTMPRLLTIWLNVGQKVVRLMGDPEASKDPWVTRFNQINRLVRKLNERIPAYQFLTAISQLASRIGHANPSVHQVLEAILINVLCVYPHQTLWQLMAVAESSSPIRKQRMRSVFAKVKSDPAVKQYSQGSLPELIQEGQALTKNLLDLCNFPVQSRETTLSVSKNFRTLERMAPLRMIVPLQSTMTVTLPSGKQSATAHRPFPIDAPTIQGFHDEVEIMNSLQRPRKLTIKGSDGRDYIFLCKPKDDLRKDCRLMEFNSMINKLLKKDPDARRRRLYIRTYAVLPLNEECGLIEWVKNTIGFRHIMVTAYKTKNIYCPPMEVKQLMERKQPSPEEIFVKMIKPKFPAIFHEWFLETFPEPTQWLASRLAYSSTIAVMSMIGYVVGLGDRHGENILFDDQTGDCVHVDLNCLFEKGLTFEKPEKVPFRLTHNMVDAFGVTGVEGVFRKCCEVTINVLRANRESLMSVLETFLYDPLCEWNKPSRRSMTAAPAISKDGEIENRQARETLDKINRKLQGYIGDPKDLTLPFSVEGQVHELIEQATSTKNLAVMYIGWTAYM
ncbi:hypothetical protein SpCBS45565_g03305 [Spizellomyces sp. 'palustris']|nr:hypothetical protein SpCBS45565_g03305 [Spizellomyces sp. 'palustris']